MTDIVERLESHMGKAEIKDVLPDCREAAKEIRTLRSRLDYMEVKYGKIAWDADDAVSRPLTLDEVDDE